MSTRNDDLYGEAYYQRSFGGIPYNRDSLDGHWPRFFGTIAEHIVQNLKPARTLDAGCAKGFLVEALRDLSVSAFGFDASSYAISEIRSDVRHYCSVGSVDDESMYDGWYDLITCIEVLEHVPMDVAVSAIRLMATHTDTIIFSSSPSDFDEPTHINVNPPERWADEFARNGFVPVQLPWIPNVIAPHSIAFVTPARAAMFELSQRVSEIGDSIQKTEKQLLVLEDLCHEQLSSRLDYIDGNVERILSTSTEMRDQLYLRESEVLRQQREQLQSELDQVQAEREQLASSLHQSNVELYQTRDKLSNIEAGRAYRVMRKLWKLRDEMMPPGTKRRRAYHKIVGGIPPVPVGLSSSFVSSQSNYAQWWEDNFRDWLQSNRLSSDELTRQRIESSKFEQTPLISIITPVYRVSPHVLDQTITSVREQSYPNWELIIVFDGKESREITDLLSAKCTQDARIRCQMIAENKGISHASNQCLEMATGEFVALLDHDDMLAPNALYEVVQVLNENPSADFIYSDKDQISEDGTTHLNPLFKGGWSWVEMMSANYPTHFCVIRNSLLRELGGFEPTTDGAQDWDIFLKTSKRARSIVHIPRVLYHWRIISTSVASGLSAKPYVIDAQRNALNAYLKSRGLDTEVRVSPNSTIRIFWKSHSVDITAIVIQLPGIGPDELIRTVRSIGSQRLRPGRLEIICTLSDEAMVRDVINHLPDYGIEMVVRTSSDHLTLTVAEAVKCCRTEYCLVMFSGYRCGGEDCLSELSGWMTNTDTPVVAGQVLTSEGRIANSGYIVYPDGRLIEVFKGMEERAYTSYGSALWYREYRAVSECCFLSRTERLSRGLTEVSKLTSGDLRQDLLLAQLFMTQAGSRAVYSPYAKAYSTSSDPLWQVPANVSRVTELIDPAFNPNVWDWNWESFTQSSVSNRKSEAPSLWSHYTSDALTLATIYDFNEADLKKNFQLLSEFQASQYKPQTALWFLPPFGSAYYGGIFTILKFAEYLNRIHGVKNTFAIVGVKSPKEAMHAIYEAVPALHGSNVVSVSDEAAMSRIPAHDVGFCTLWTTAYNLLKFNRLRRKIYFLQDYEPLFYPAGATSAQVEATYRFGFDAVCNTVSLQKSYEMYGGRAVYFTPSVNSDVFHKPIHETRDASRPYTVFLYGRPGNPRNAFELAVPALKKVKQIMKDEVRIVSAGAEWDARAYGLEGVIEHLGMLPYEKTGDLYRQCHVGLTMMLTRHPSYLPFELMACGCVVVAVKNEWNEWMLRDRENCIIAEPSASCIAESIVDTLRNASLRESVQEGGYSFIVSSQSWDATFQSLAPFVIGGPVPSQGTE